MTDIPLQRALISVSDKTGVVEFAEQLIKLNIAILSTGGTSQLLAKANIPHRLVEEETGLPEMLHGRVKTLHHKIHSGILALRDQHADEIQKQQIQTIDLVVVNFYPFAKVTADQPIHEAIEFIDIGGPAMVRAAAKNFAWVGVIVDPNDYPKIIEELKIQRTLSEKTRKELAKKAFALTASYDAMIHHYLKNKEETEIFPEYMYLQLKKSQVLRYGENPHQRACAYQCDQQSSLLSTHQYQGKVLSYNNILDAEAALACVAEFNESTCVIVKHANPCGVASSATIEDTFTAAYAADPESAFGGIVALNRLCTKILAENIIKNFVEVVLAPDYAEEALSIFAKKPTIRVLKTPNNNPSLWEMRAIHGGILLQEKDIQVIRDHDLQLVTQKQPSPTEIHTMLFAWRVLKHIKSNAILIAKDQRTVGVGAGQVSRIDAVEMAIRKAEVNINDTILASDAFFPFRDSIDRIAKTNICAIIQPGGSLRDKEVIQACNEHGIAMVFTGKRCFKH